MDENIDKVQVRVRCLVEFTRQAISTIRYKNGVQLVTIHGTDDSARLGGTMALTFHKSNGDDVPCEKIEILANNERISLRSGCLCNPAMTAILLKRKKDIQNIGEHLTFSSLLEKMGVDSLGVVRISFGVASNCQDAKKFLAFAERLATGLELD
jgi:selenocysteine lyase/cysteine desulfurase